jgi:hypothetical protein
LPKTPPSIFVPFEQKIAWTSAAEVAGFPFDLCIACRVGPCGALLRSTQTPPSIFVPFEQKIAWASAAGVAWGYSKANCANRTIRAAIIRNSIAAFYLDLNQCKNTNSN